MSILHIYPHIKHNFIFRKILFEQFALWSTFSIYTIIPTFKKEKKTKNEPTKIDFLVFFLHHTINYPTIYLKTSALLNNFNENNLFIYISCIQGWCIFILCMKQNKEMRSISLSFSNFIQPLNPIHICNEILYILCLIYVPTFFILTFSFFFVQKRLSNIYKRVVCT